MSHYRHKLYIEYNLECQIVFCWIHLAINNEKGEQISPLSTDSELAVYHFLVLS